MRDIGGGLFDTGEKWDVKALEGMTPGERAQEVARWRTPLSSAEGDIYPLFPLITNVEAPVTKDFMNRVMVIMKRFPCVKCGSCCTKTNMEGVTLGPGELDHLALFTALSRKQFKDRHTFMASKNRCLKVPCYFYTNGCRVYYDRPLMCRFYPLRFIPTQDPKRVALAIMMGCDGAVGFVQANIETMLERKRRDDERKKLEAAGAGGGRPHQREEGPGDRPEGSRHLAPASSAGGEGAPELAELADGGDGAGGERGPGEGPYGSPPPVGPGP